MNNINKIKFNNKDYFIRDTLSTQSTLDLDKQNKLTAGDDATRLNGAKLSTKQIFTGSIDTIAGAVPTLLPAGGYIYNSADKKLYIGDSNSQPVEVAKPNDFLFFSNSKLYHYQFGNFDEVETGTQGPQGPAGPKGDQGNSGYSGAAGELKVVNNLTEGGEVSALSAEMGKVLAERLAEADAKWTDIDHGEAMSVDCVKQIRSLTLTVIGDVYDSMSLDGVKNVMALTATYDDRSTEPITEFTVTGVVKAGNQNFIATYNGIKASLAVEVRHRTATLSSISANSSVNEVSMWTETEELRKYITVTKVYSDSTTELTKDYTLSGELQQGASTITVSYYGDTTKTTTLTFTGVNDGSYVTDSLEAMVDFSDYEDGYTGEIIDKAKGHQVVLNASLANAATKAPYGGIHGGKLVQAQWYEGTSGKGLTMDLKECAPAGVVTVELYARIRGKYSGSGATPTIGAISTYIMAMSSFAISPNNAYVNECRYAPQGEINLKGPTANPDITTSGLNLPYYDSSHTDVKELVHIVYTMANKLQKLYVNGQLIIDDSRGGYSCTGGTDVRIFPNLGYVAADIAVVRVYGKALNNKEVQRNYLNCQAKHGSQIN